MSTQPINPLPSDASPAYVKFHESLAMNYERWHDGTGIDLDGVDEMTRAEQEEALAILLKRSQTPREIEAIARLVRRGVTVPTDPIGDLERTAADAYAPAESRLAALEELNGLGRIPNYDERLAAEIRKLTRDGPGLTRALLMAEAHPTETIKQALLWASWNQTACSPFCAGLVCYLAGVSKEPFDFEQRDFFLEFNPHTNYFERKAAFDELLKRVRMEFRADQG